MNTQEPIRLGLIGCGGFGEFCLQGYSQMPDVQIVAVADVFEPAAARLGQAFSVPAHTDPQELIDRPDVDLVHIATPPSSHYELVMASAKAGKNVLCEKPLAMNTAQADEMLAACESKSLAVPVNFVLRYNRVTDAVKAVIDSGVLGKVLAARLTNCAGDSKLGADHWFWDKDISGGIFIEHGVHFFDLYRYWLGEGRVISAHTLTREGTTQEDRVMCTVAYDCGAVANHHHGFDQTRVMDRTDHRMVCEMGDIRVDGWIPLTLTIDAVVDDEGAEKLAACCEGCNVEVIEDFGPDGVETTGRGKKHKVTKRIRIRYEPDSDKQKVYADSAKLLLADQIAFIRDRSHVRRIGDNNGRDAVALAQAAAEMAAD